MARTIRIQYPGALYHVMCRGDRREAIFEGDGDREVFLETLGEVCGRTGFVIHAYVLMGNHYHLRETWWGCRGQSVHMIIFGLRPTFALSRSPAWHEPFAFSIRGRFTM